MSGEIFSALCFAWAGYQAMQAVKYVVGLVLMVTGSRHARWWHEEIICGLRP